MQAVKLAATMNFNLYTVKNKCKVSTIKGSKRPNEKGRKPLF